MPGSYDIDEELLRRQELLNAFYATNQPMADPHKATTDLHYGLDATGYGRPTSNAKDEYKMVFITRPLLNLTDANLRRDRRLASLGNTNDNSPERYVRMMLDPRLHYGDGNDGEQEALKSDIVDPENPFIPLLGTTLTKLSGWPDTVAPTYTTKPGVEKETMSLIDGSTRIYNDFELDATFTNVRGETGLKLFETWVTVPATNFANQTMPYLDLLFENEIDYATRIYIIVLSSDMKRIKRVACTGYSFPITLPDGKFFDVDKTANVRTAISEYTIRFKSHGALYNDHIIMEEFNSAVNIFNPNMDMLSKGEDGHDMVRVPKELQQRLNHRMYPRINTETSELEWWIAKSTLEELPVVEDT